MSESRATDEPRASIAIRAREDDGGGPKRIQSVDRASQLLKMIMASGCPLSVGELADPTGLNRSTAWRLLMTLEHHGLVDRDPDSNGYVVGYELLRLAAVKPAYESLISRARTTLDELSALSRENVTLYVPVPSGIVSVDQRESPQVGVVNTLGVELPLHATATGKLRLAFAAEDGVESWLGKPLAHCTDNTIIDPDDLRRELAAVRSRGYALEIDEFELGVSSASAPIFAPDGRPSAFLSIAGLSARLPRKRLVELGSALMAAGEGIAKNRDSPPR